MTVVSNEAELRAEVLAGGTAEIAAGVVIELTNALVIPDEATITSENFNNLGTIRARQNQTRSLIANGLDITLSTFRYDMDAGPWKGFQAGIAFNASGTYGFPPSEKGRILFENLEFVRDWIPRAPGDNWCINFASDFPGELHDITVRGCSMAAQRCQLTAGGQNTIYGLRNFEITNNFTYRGEANSISLSSSGQDVTFTNINISRNVIIQPYSLGVFIGLDSDQSPGSVTLDGYAFEDNHCFLMSAVPGEEKDFRTCFYTRVTNSAEDIALRHTGNTYITRGTNQPRYTTPQAIWDATKNRTLHLPDTIDVGRIFGGSHTSLNERRTLI